VHFVSTNPADNPKADLAESNPTLKFWASIPTMFTSLTIHTSYYVAFNLLKEKTTKNGIMAGVISYVIMMTVYQASSLISIGLYGNQIKSNMLVGLISAEGVLPIILLIMFLFIAVMHIPIIFYIGKEAVLIIFDEITRKSYSKGKMATTPCLPQLEVPMEAELPAPNSDSNPGQSNDEEVSEDHKEKNEGGQDENEIEVAQQVDPEAQSSQKDADNSKAETKTNPKEYLNMRPLYYYLITTLAFSFVVITSIVAGNVSIVFGIIGSVVSTFTVLVGPGSFYIIATHKKDIKFTGKWSIFTYVMAWILVTIGLI
jgi:hypothetical protein